MKKTLRQNLKGLDKKEYEVLRSLCHLSKNLYNETLYQTRQHFFETGEYLNYYNTWEKLKNESQNYRLLPSQAAQQAMKKVDEAYTSKCSALDKEPIEKHEEHRGTRMERGLFKASDGTLVNADVNGALNIARKGNLETILGVESSGTVAVPQRIRVH